MHTTVTAHHSFIKGGEEDMEDEASLDQFGIVTKGRKFSSRSVVAENEAESNEKPRRYRGYGVATHLRESVRSTRSDVISRESSTKRSSRHGTTQRHRQKREEIQLEEITVHPQQDWSTNCLLAWMDNQLHLQCMNMDHKIYLQRFGQESYFLNFIFDSDIVACVYIPYMDVTIVFWAAYFLWISSHKKLLLSLVNYRNYGMLSPLLLGGFALWYRNSSFSLWWGVLKWLCCYAWTIYSWEQLHSKACDRGKK